jgi:hypothetical protein
MKRYTIAEDGKSITCHACGKTSHHPQDVERRYCGHCGRFHDDHAADALEVERVVEKIKPLLAGRSPDVQGAILADLLALYIAGHHPAMREEVMQLTIETARKLIEPNEQAIFEQRGGKPPGWEKQ